MEGFFRRLKYYFYASIAITLLVIFWPHGPHFNDMARDRDATLADNLDTLNVGVSWPIEKRGPDLVQGMELAIDHIKDTGLLKDTTIQLDVRDDMGEIKKAQDIATAFADNETMSAVIGYGHDRQATAASIIYQSAHLLQIVVGAHSTQLNQRDQPYLIRAIPSAKDFAGKLAASLGDKPKTFALIREKSGYWEEFAEDFSIHLYHKGAKRVFHRTYPVEIPPDYVHASLEIRELDADFILFAGQANEAGRFIKKARDIGITQPILCSCTDIDTLRKAVGKHQQNVFLPGFYDPNLTSPVNQKFFTDYQTKFGKKPNRWAAQGYDALFVLAHAVRQSQSVKPSDIAWTIRYMPPVEGTSGQFDFTEDGDLTGKPVYIHSLQTPSG
ncbi:ABC transporter substrate-binding protein [Terasakiella sp. A23]|uniref:ABC transporter substrate-binding protein n=1 Tax=Terasakiella sp. FCG-A23 TaxID=3080561 RepID=UPI0029534017|nr:ABC transporter substrate-binding protein [Terasakiella sp. A23]MDV7340254.1 ABC transporter substrate-binding protein [Terasakiella sp. A23]